MRATPGATSTTPGRTLAERAARWEAALAELSSAPAPYGALVTDHLPDDVTGSLAGRSEQVLLEGTADVTLLLADIEAVTTGIEGLEDAVEGRRADDVRDAVDAARAREQRSLLLAGSALVGLVAVDRGELSQESEVKLRSQMLFDAYLSNYPQAIYGGWSLEALQARSKHQIRILLAGAKRG